MRRELTEEENRLVIRCLEDQFNLGHVLADDEMEMAWLLRSGLIGMDGFKYCWPEIAKDNWRRCHP